MAEINVTPLVDVMLVLLIIFMVTAPLLVDWRAGRTCPKVRAKATGSGSRSRCIVSLDRAVARFSSTTSPSRWTICWAKGWPACAAPRTRGRRPGLAADCSCAPTSSLDYGRVMQVMGELNQAGLNRVALVSVGVRREFTIAGSKFAVDGDEVGEDRHCRDRHRRPTRCCSARCRRSFISRPILADCCRSYADRALLSIDEAGIAQPMDAMQWSTRPNRYRPPRKPRPGAVAGRSRMQRRARPLAMPPQPEPAPPRPAAPKPAPAVREVAKAKPCRPKSRARPNPRPKRRRKSQHRQRRKKRRLRPSPRPEGQGARPGWPLGDDIF